MANKKDYKVKSENGVLKLVKTLANGKDISVVGAKEMGETKKDLENRLIGILREMEKRY